MSTPNKLPGPAVMIKSEPGTSRSTSLRLPSFKPPRDMMLGGPVVDLRPNRKVYVPNLNVQRKKNQEEVSVKAEPGIRRGTANQRGGRGRGERGGRKQFELIQSTGSIFSEGLANVARLKRESKYEGGGGGGGSGRNASKSKSRIALSNNIEDDDRLAYLLKEGFIDDPGICPDDANKPMQLLTPKYQPVSDEDAFTKKESQDKTEVVINGVKVKEENVDDPVPNSEASELREIFTLPKLFQSTSPKYILMKLPSGLSTPEDAVNDVARPSTSLATPEESEKKKSQSCNLPEGRVGTLQLMKSGQVRLLIGNQLFDASLGTQTNVRQELMCVNIHPDGSGGDMVALGSIDTNIITSRRPIETTITRLPPK